MAARNMNDGTPVTVMIDKTITTPKGDIRVYLDYQSMRENVDNYYDKLRSARRIPFELSNINPLDPAIIEASARFDYMTPEQVLDTVRQHYEVLSKKVLMQAWIVAATKETKKLAFDPTPYDPPDAPTDDWDIHLSEPEPNLINPVERRLKQITDMLAESDNPMVIIELQNAMMQFGIMMERRVRELDGDGFRSGRTDRDVSPKTQSVSVVQKTQRPRSRVVGLPRGDGDTGHEVQRPEASANGGGVPEEDPR